MFYSGSLKCPIRIVEMSESELRSGVQDKLESDFEDSNFRVQLHVQELVSLENMQKNFRHDLTRELLN